MPETQTSSAIAADQVLRRQIPDLFDIAENVRTMVDAAIVDADNETGEVDPLKFSAILAEQEEFKEIALGIGMMVKELDADADKVKAAVAALNLRKGFFKNRAERLKSSLYEALMARGYSALAADKEMRKIVGTLCTLTMAKGIEVLNVVNEDEIPEEYWKNDPVLDKVALKKALKELKGEETIPGAELKRNPQSLRIKLDTT